MSDELALVHAQRKPGCCTCPDNFPYIIIIYYYCYYYAKVIFAHSYSENSHERANESNMLKCIVQSSGGDEMTRQRVHPCGVVLVARSTLTAQRLQSCDVDRNGLSSSVER